MGIIDASDTLPFKDKEALEGYMSTPSDRLIKFFRRTQGDVIILGVGGKMGTTLAWMAKRALTATKSKHNVYGVSRFSNTSVREFLEKIGVKTFQADLLDRRQIADLPDAEYVVYMAGKKFGTSDNPGLTWVMNSVVPTYVCHRYRESRIVAFSTGCVYPLVDIRDGAVTGSKECEPPNPVGEYAQSCLARERVFQYYSELNNTPVLLFRLNYAIDLRYGVLHDIALRIKAQQPVPLDVPYFNVIWQGDACNYALLSFALCDSPANILNATGPETIFIQDVIRRFKELDFARRTIPQEQRIGGRKDGAGDTNDTTITNGKHDTRAEKNNCDNPGAHNREGRAVHVEHLGVRAYLSDATKCFGYFGYPQVTLDRMISWQYYWLEQGLPTLDKPTHFEVNDGKF